MAFEGQEVTRIADIGLRFQLATQTVLLFEDNYRTLLLRAADENFWTGAVDA
jgi:hypothetical protein